MVHLCESAASLQDKACMPLENGDAAMREPSEDFFFFFWGGGGAVFFRQKVELANMGWLQSIGWCYAALLT